MKKAVKIDDYTLLYECGRGAFGTVYLAKNSEGRYVALKMISLLGDVGDRELQALESYKKCSQNEFMLQVYDVVQKDGPPPFFYYTMEPADNILGEDSEDYVPCTLAEVLKRQKTLTASQTIELIAYILTDLQVIHEQHLVHRDIKPANIFWVNKCAKLGDMGLLANEHSMTCNAGSPGFMPPADSGIDVNSTAVDLFAITRLIYVCLSGNNANHYPELDLTDDLMEHGSKLFLLMNLTNQEIAQMSVADFQNILNPRRWMTASMTYSSVGDSIGRSFSSTSVADTESLDSLSSIQNNTSAGNWLKNIDPAALGAVGVGAGTVVAAGALGLIGAPVVLTGLAAGYIYKKLKKK